MAKEKSNRESIGQSKMSKRYGTENGSTHGLQGRHGNLSSEPVEKRQRCETVNLSEIRQRILLDEFSPESCVIDERGRVLNTSDGIGQYLSVSSDEFQHNILKVVIGDLRIGLKAAIEECQKSMRKVHYGSSATREGDVAQRVMLTVQPILPIDRDASLFLVVFSKIELPIERNTSTSTACDDVKSISALADKQIRERGELSLAFFADLVSSISDLRRPDEITRVACQQIRTHLGLSHCCLVDVDETESTANVFHDDCVSGQDDLCGTYDMGEFWSEEDRDTLRNGNVLIVNDTTGEFCNANSTANLATLQMGALINVGCTKEHRLSFILAAIKPESYQWRDDEVELLREIGDTLYLRIERARADEALRESEEHLRRVISNQLGLVGVIDRHGKLLEVDDRSVEIAGLTRNEVIGKHFADCAWWTYDRKVAQKIRAAMTQAFAGEKVRFDTALFSKDGPPVTIDFMIAPVRGDDGNIEFLIPSGVDISDRKAAEKKLADNERRLKMAMKAAGMAVWEWTKEASYWTDELYELMGLDIRQGASPELFFSAVHPDDIEQLKSNWEKSINEGDSYEAEFRMIRPNGEVRWIYGVGEVVRNKSNRIVRVFGLNWDNTRNHIAAEQLRESERQAQAASESKTEFLANMSHEIRTPMSAILGYTDILARHLKDPDDLNCVSIIRSNGNFLLEIINDILDISKIEAGKIDLIKKPFRIDQLIADVRSLMQIRASEKLLDLQIELTGNVPQKIKSDAKRLKQILVNLVGNAIKFTETGSVRLVVSYQASSDSSSKPRMRFDVIDTGIGIKARHFEQLFQPFTQGDASVNRKYGGTGLGLAISQRLAEMLGGKIDVKSDAGKGSTFSLSIAAPTSANPTFLDKDSWDQAKRKGTPSQKKRGAEKLLVDGIILVVDDRREIRFIAQHFIEEAGGAVVTSENGQEAIDAIQLASESGQPFDLVIIDMQMPVLDGYEATRRLRASGFDKPIIALTAHAMEGDREKCLAAGCSDYLSKPLDGPVLVRKLVNYLNQNSTVPSKGKKILVVEDNEEAAEAISYLIGLNGHNVDISYNGASAIEKAKSFQPDIIFLDLGLPDMSGLEVLAELKKIQSLSHTLFVALTGCELENVAVGEDRTATNFDHYIRKPIDVDALERFILGA